MQSAISNKLLCLCFYGYLIGSRTKCRGNILSVLIQNGGSSEEGEGFLRGFKQSIQRWYFTKNQKKKAESNGAIMGSGTSRCSKGKRHGKLNSFIVTESDYIPLYGIEI